MEMKLQYFAEPDSADTQPESAASEVPTAKYTQEDVNKMMAAKAKEVESSVQSALAGQLEEQKSQWLAEGEKRAGMSAQEKAQASLQDERQALQEQQDRLQARLDEADKRDALTATRSALTASHIPIEFADYLSDIKEDVRNNNVTKFGALFKAAIEQAVDERVKGTVTPQTGGATTTQSISTTDFSKLSLEQRMALAQKDPAAYTKLSNQ